MMASASLVFGCSTQLDTQQQDNSNAASQVQVANKRFGYGGHILPWRAPGKAAPKKTAAANLVYNGGPVVSAVDVCPVFWGLERQLDGDVGHRRVLHRRGQHQRLRRRPE